MGWKQPGVCWAREEQERLLQGERQGQTPEKLPSDLLTHSTHTPVLTHICKIINKGEKGKGGKTEGERESQFKGRLLFAPVESPPERHSQTTPRLSCVLTPETREL